MVLCIFLRIAQNIICLLCNVITHPFASRRQAFAYTKRNKSRPKPKFVPFSYAAVSHRGTQSPFLPHKPLGVRIGLHLYPIEVCTTTIVQNYPDLKKARR